MTKHIRVITNRGEPNDASPLTSKGALAAPLTCSLMPLPPPVCTSAPLQSLVLLRELIRFGSDRVIEETRDHMYNLRSLENFRFQEDGKVSNAHCNIVP